MRKALLSLALCLSFTGCISQAVKDQVETECMVHSRVLGMWDNLSPAQRLEAYEASTYGWHAQRYNVLDKKIPEEVQKLKKDAK